MLGCSFSFRFSLVATQVGVMAAPASPLLHILRFEHSASRVNPAVSVSVMCLSRPSLALPVHGLTCCVQQRRGIYLAGPAGCRATAATPDEVVAGTALLLSSGTQTAVAWPTMGDKSGHGRTGRCDSTQRTRAAQAPMRQLASARPTLTPEQKPRPT